VAAKNALQARIGEFPAIWVSAAAFGILGPEDLADMALRRVDSG
jgi:hypothetical protein